MSAATCEAWVPHRMLGGQACGNPVKGNLENGTPACGRHLAGERRRKENAAERHADELKRREAERVAEARVDSVGAARPFLEPRAVYRTSYTSAPGRYEPDRIEVDYAELQRLLSAEDGETA